MPSEGSADSIVVLGGGIIGLDVALVLAKRGLGKYVTIVAEYFPGDTSSSYTSPWAGCNFSGISGSDKNALRWDRMGYAHLTNLASTQSKASFVERTHSVEYWDANAPRDKIKAIAEYLEDFKVIPTRDLPDGVEFGFSCTSVTVNAPKHIEYLYKTLKEDYGVSFIRKKLPSIQAAYLSKNTKVVFNCTGNSAKTLPGVEDSKCFPTRGQVVLARAPTMKRNLMRHGRDYETYIIPRPQSNGNVILGGYMQKGNGDGSTYGHQTESIVSRTAALSAELAEGPVEVLASFAGLRPSREGGARIERQNISVGRSRRALVHNYGAGGTGFQAGYGMAMDAVETVDDVLKKLQGRLGSKL